jgi:predicted dehydrogenase
MDPAFSYRGLRLRTKRGDAKSGSAEDAEILLEPVNHFQAEMDHFSECVLHDRETRTPGEMGLADMKIIAAIAEAAKTGRVAKV